MTASRQQAMGVALLLAVAALVGVAWAGDDADKSTQATQATLMAKTDAIVKKVATLRGLRVKRTVKRGVMNKEQIRARILERMNEDYAPEELAAEELAMKRLGLLPANVDYKKLVIDLLTNEIAGFYDPSDQQLYIAGWQQGLAAMGDGVMAHEIDHALQDQHFNLRRFMRTVKNDGDATAARQALVEGDGMGLMLEYMMPAGSSPWADDRVVRMMTEGVGGAGGMARSGALGPKVPLVLELGLIFPYTAGLKFIAYFRRSETWKRIDRMYKKPPLATEHILHPTKYETYERPDIVRAAKPPAVGLMISRYDNVSGELGLLIWLRQHGVATERANIAAAGWGGDRLVIYVAADSANSASRQSSAVDPASAIAVNYTVWDHSADAIEFFEAAGDALALLSGVEPESRSATRIVYRPTDRNASSSVERRGDAVVLIIGAPADRTQSDALRSQVWSKWTVKRR